MSPRRSLRPIALLGATRAPSLRASLAIACALVACSRPPGASGSGARGASEDLGGCAPSALGLAHAQALTAWRAPDGCTLRHGGPAPTPARSEAEFASAWSCPRGVGSGVDWSRASLWSLQTTLPPAGVGYSVFLEGSRVTLVARMRSPCPDDPRPMPVPYELAFLAPATPEVTVAQTVCTLPPRCR